jgi:signal transduction histidine kinase
MKQSSLLLIIVLCSISNAFSQAIDTVQIRQFSYTTYKAGITTYSGAEGKNGKLFFANSEGLLIYDGSNWELLEIDNNSSVQAVMVDNERVYVGGTNEFGFVDRDEQGYWQYHSLRSMLHADQPLNNVWQVLKTTQGIYFVSYNMILRYQNDKITEIPVLNSYAYVIEDNLVCSSFDGIISQVYGDSIVEVLEIPEQYDDAAFAILPTKEKGEYHYFTTEHGIYSLTLNPLKLTKWDVPISEVLKVAGVYSAVRYNDDIIVCSTWREGVILFNSKGNVIRKINIKSGLPNLELRDAFIDSNQNIWVTSNSGIYQMRFTLNATTDNFIPKTYIRSLTTRTGNTYNINNLTSIYDPESIIFSYTTPGVNAEDLEYSFFLRGFDNDWSPYSKQYTKEYSNLNHGRYTFMVKSRVIGTSIESIPGNLSLSITLPWYKRKYLYIIGFSLITISVFLYLRIRARRMLNDKRNLERRVSKRTKELSIEREKLQAVNSELKLANSELDHFVYRSSHDLVAPLKSLQGLMMVAKMDTKDAQMHQYLDLMESSTVKLETFIGSIMEYSVNAKSDVATEEIVLENLLNQILEEIKYFDKSEKIEFILDLEGISLISDAKRLKIILNNLITNAIKYHDLNKTNPFVKISARKTENTVQLIVTDNGQGIADENLENVFQMFYRASEKSDGSGLGLYIVKDTINKINGKIYIESKLGEGTTVSIEVPDEA